LKFLVSKLDLYKKIHNGKEQIFETSANKIAIKMNTTTTPRCNAKIHKVKSLNYH